MEHLQQLWHFVEKAVIAAFKVSLGLYVVRCVIGFRIVGLDQFGHFLRTLVAYIFG